MSDRTEISSLGEFGLIEHLTKNIELQNASSIVGVGDDAAVIDHFGKQTVISSDMLVEGVHFDLMYTPLKHLGYKSIIANLSDIYAMNATPTQIILNIAISNRFSVEALDEFYVIGSLLKQEARKDIIEFFAEEKILPTSMMDISDGLSSEILHIAKESNLGAEIREEKIPIAEETRAAAYKFQIDPTACALSSGEDYELLFTIDQNDYEKLSRHGDISVIGFMTDAEQGNHIITKGGNKHVITAQGWNAFKQ